MADETVLAVYTTDARPQYLRHILTASALPRGSVITNRYAQRYVEPAVWSDWCTGKLVKLRVLVLYIDGDGGRGPGSRALAIRWGVVKNSAGFGHYGLLDVELHEHAGAEPVANLLECADGGGLLDPGPRQGLLVIRSRARERHIKKSRDLVLWEDTIEKLGRLPSLRHASFIYVEGIAPLSSDKPVRTRHGVTNLKKGRTYEVALYGMSPDIHPEHQRYLVNAAGGSLEIRDFNEFQLGYRFDLLRIPVAARTHNRAVSRLRVSPAPGTRGPEVEIRIRVRGPALLRFLALSSPGLAAALAASAGVLPAGTPFWLRVAVLLTGSACLAIVTRRQ